LDSDLHDAHLYLKRRLAIHVKDLHGEPLLFTLL